MTNPSPYRLAKLEEELRPEGKKALDAVAEFFDEPERTGFRVVERSDNELRLQIGPLSIFFRIAYGLQPNAYVQFGHYVLRPDGNTRPEVDGEWVVRYGSSLSHVIRQPHCRILGATLHSVSAAVVEKHGESVRIVQGIVQPHAEVTPSDPDLW